MYSAGRYYTVREDTPTWQWMERERHGIECSAPAPSTMLSPRRSKTKIYWPTYLAMLIAATPQSDWYFTGEVEQFIYSNVEGCCRLWSASPVLWPALWFTPLLPRSSRHWRENMVLYLTNGVVWATSPHCNNETCLSRLPLARRWHWKSPLTCAPLGLWVFLHLLKGEGVAQTACRYRLSWDEGRTQNKEALKNICP